MIAAEALSPYKGLRAFEDSEGDVPFFFGRERERAQIEANLMASRLTVVYGETGVGKSSVLRAGVAHHLCGVARENFERRGEPELAVIMFDDWRGDPVAALRSAVAEEVTHALGGTLPAPVAADAPLADTLRAWQELLGGDVYIVLDQLEEYFLYHRDEEGPGTFAVEFPAAVDAADLRVNFLLALREESLAKLDAFKARIPNVLGNCLRLDHLDREAARSAIVGPVARYSELTGDSIEIEPALVEEVLGQVAVGKVELRSAGRGIPEASDAEPRIETPYLQLVMQRIWDEERAAGSRVLRFATLGRLGGADQIVGAHVDRALTALNTSDRDLAAAMFDHLVTPSGAKIAHEAADLARYAGEQEPAVVAVLDRLGGDRIVRMITNGGANGSRYEIFHDVLAEPVLAWKAAHDTHRELERQRVEVERRHRRLLLVTALAGVALAVMICVTVFALMQRGEARSQARLAAARQLAAEAVSHLQVDPQRSLALAIASAERRQTSEAKDVLMQALIASRERAVLPSGGPVRVASFSPDGSLVLTGSDDGIVRVWRRDGTPVRTLVRGSPVTVARFSPDGRLLLTGGRDGVAAVRRLTTGALVASLRHVGAVTSGAFADGGRLAVTTGTDGVTRLWRPATGKVVLAVRQDGPVQTASLSPDGRALVTVGSNPGGEDRRARIFAVPNGRLLRLLPANGVTTASFSPNGRLLVTGGVDHTAAVWDMRSGRLLHLLAEHEGAVTDALFGPGGRLLATTSSDGATRIWNARTGARVALLLGHANAVNAASFSPDGRFLLTVSTDGTARVWEAGTGRLQTVLRGHTDAVGEGAFASHGSAVVTAGADGTARIWDPATAPELRVLATAPGPVRAAVFSPDGRRMLEAGDDRAARILTAGGKVLRVLWHAAPVTSAVFGPAGSPVLTADEQGTLRAWRADSGALVRTSRGNSAGPLAVSSDGKVVAAPGKERGVWILDAATFAPVRELGRGGRFTAVAFSPDGRLVAGAGEDGKARIWDTRTGVLVRTFAGHSDVLTGVGFSADGSQIVTSSRDRDARVWDVGTGASTLLRGHFGPVFAASFSPDGQLVVTAGPTTAGLWRASNGKLISYLRGHDEALTGASFSPDGFRILTAGRDGTVRIYACEVCGGLSRLVDVAKSRLEVLARPLSAADRTRLLPAAALAESK